ncbi:MAG: HAMP domain-containing histidine kinase [Chloroflexi bacterium]|nr:HAMP domain-containing histidine kinase [Chloroflexota bacterium]
MMSVGLEYPNTQPQPRRPVQPVLRPPLPPCDSVQAARAASLRHDMANCLSALRLRSELFSRENFLPAEHLASIVQIASRLELLLRDWSVLCSGNGGSAGHNASAQFDLSHLLYHTVEANRPAAVSRHLTFTLYRQTTHALMIGSESAVQRALDNLIANAIKYSRSGGNVAITLTIDTGWATITIIDNGIGIPSAELEQVFAPYYRASNASTSGAEGHGLGLFQAKDSVEWHGGTLHLLSKEDLGTEAILRLPLASTASS